MIACPTCGRLQFDMDTVVAEIEERLRAYDDPIEVAVLGCAVNGIGEASNADFGITGAKNEGSSSPTASRCGRCRRPSSSMPCSPRSTSRSIAGRCSSTRARPPRAPSGSKIEAENAGELAERIAAMEAAAASEEALGNGSGLPMAGASKAKRITLDEDASPTAGRRFTRALAQGATPGRGP